MFKPSLGRPAQVEILLPEFWDPLSGPVYAEEGDQQRFWKLTRRYLDNLVRLQPSKKIRAVRLCSWGFLVLPATHIHLLDPPIASSRLPCCYQHALAVASLHPTTWACAKH